MRDGRFIHRGAAPRAYDVEADPGETRDLSAENPRMADALARALTDMASKTATRAVAQQPRPVDPDVEQQLRALATWPRRSRGRRSKTVRGATPRTRSGLYNLLKRAAQDSVDGRIDDGIAKVREVLAGGSRCHRGLHDKPGNSWREDRRSGFRRTRRALAPSIP
ncbi:MAG: hypothetical protein R2712_04285 [Vicinamibacterales bacterium]